MRYAIFTDIHANLEALETVLKKIDELSAEEPIDEIWFLGDLVGYGPNPNECIAKLRERTNVIIAGNHDWAAVGKIDLEDFSEAARISAEWTAEQLTEENRQFLANLPERIEKGECVLVHGSPYGPLWEYLTSEILAERSFQQFSSRYCFVGHTHVPVIFQQPDEVANAPTRPMDLSELMEEQERIKEEDEDGTQIELPVVNEQDTDEEMVSIQQTAKSAETPTGTHAEISPIQEIVTAKADTIAGLEHQLADDAPDTTVAAPGELKEALSPNEASASEATVSDEEGAEEKETEEEQQEEIITPEEDIQGAEERLNQEIEELLTLLGLSQSMIEVTNEMVLPPEGTWQAPGGYRAIVNPGGVGQPRDGDPRAAFMIYDPKKGFTFYRIEYDYEATQEKIVKAKLPPYLATRLAYGR